MTCHNSLQAGKCVWISCTSSISHGGCVKICFYIIYCRGHKESDKYCRKETNPHDFPELKPVNSVICEQTFSYTNHYSNMKVINGPRYNFFWLYILDLHNHYVEDPRVQEYKETVYLTVIY